MFTPNSLQNFKQIKLMALEVLHFHLFNVLQGASVTSHLSENEVENLQNVYVHLAQIPDFEMEYLENHLEHWGHWWLIFFGIFHALSFELNFFSTGGSL